MKSKHFVGVILFLVVALQSSVFCIDWRQQRKQNARSVFIRSRQALLSRFQRGKVSKSSRKRFANRLYQNDVQHPPAEINFLSLIHLFAHAKKRYDMYGQF